MSRIAAGALLLGACAAVVVWIARGTDHEPLLGARSDARSEHEAARTDELPAAAVVAASDPTRLVAEREEEATGTTPADGAAPTAGEVPARDLGFVILDAMKKGQPPDPELVRDHSKFDQLFVPASTGPALNGAPAAEDLKVQLVDGATLTFAAGAFRVELEPALRTLHPVPKDLTVAGAGIDLTLLVMGDLSTHGKLARFTLRDCTVFNDGPLFDQRTGADSTITLDHVRVVGFDCGAGGSHALDLDANALRARDCIFEGGYGRHPTGRSNLLDVRTDAMVARFDRCRFVQLSLELRRHADWRIVFAWCSFEDLRQDDSTIPPERTSGIEFDACTFTLFDPKEAKPPSKDLDRLFPDWERQTRR